MKLIFWLLFQFTCNYAANTNITNNNSINIRNEYPNERRLVVVAASTAAVISAIAATTVATVNVGNVLVSQINNYGAAININNYFKNIDLHRDGFKIMDGATSPIKSPEITILKAHINICGGVFEDASYSIDGSAGIVRYKATNKLTSKEYCFDYMWSIDSSVMEIERNCFLCLNDVLNGGMAIVISSDRCSMDLTTSFNSIRDFWMDKVNDGKSGNTIDYDVREWNVRYSGYMSGYAMIAFESFDNLQNIRISSNDYVVAMKASMTNADKTSIEITIGPYKKIYGDYTHGGNWFPFMVGRECTGAETKLGQFENVNDCVKACKNTKKSDCKFLVFGMNSNYGWCYWEGGCTGGWIGNSYVIMSVTDSDYELVENLRKCTGGDRLYLGWFRTTDGCKQKCVEVKGDDCVFFIYGTHWKFGYCYWEESCASDNSFTLDDYNVYVVSSKSNMFKGNNNKFVRDDIFENKYGKDAINVINENNDYFKYMIGAICVCMLAFNILCIFYKRSESTKKQFEV